jgi:hypothetical protein
MREWRGKVKNEYEIRGKVTAIIITSKKHGRIETLINTRKLEKAKEFPYRWGITQDKNTHSMYVVGTILGANKKRITTRLHRWITNAPEGLVVDHINHNTLDNTDENLRVLTAAENGQNRKGAIKNSKSGVRGVCWVRKINKWRVVVTINKKRMNLGYFKKIEEAEKVAVEARKKYMPYSQEYSA